MISLSNLVKQHYVINYGNETRVINADDRFRTNAVIPEPEVEIQGDVDGFMPGLMAEEVFVEPEITPEDILNQAREEAEHILALAKAEATSITNDANRRADLLFEQKKQQGYQEGVSRLQDEILERKAKLQEEYDQLKVELEQMREAVQADYEAKLDVLETDMVDVMIRVFHQVFHVQFDNKKQILLHLIKDTMLGIDSGKNFVIRVAECNYKYIESHVADVKEKIGNDVTIDIVNDMHMNENDCIIETATGVFNCGIDMVLSNLEKDIRSLCR